MLPASKIITKEIAQRHIHSGFDRIIPKHLQANASNFNWILIDREPDPLDNSFAMNVE